MTDKTIYTGENFAILMSAFGDDGATPEDMTAYDAVVQIATSALGAKIIASTETGREVVIARRSNSVLALNISGELTSKLSDGTLTLTVMLTHKSTHVKMIAQTQTIEIKHSELSKI